MSSTTRVYPLHHAVQSCSVKVVRSALTQRPSQFVPDNNRDLPLHLAAGRGDPAIISLLQIHNKRDRNGLTPFMRAAKAGHAVALRHLRTNSSLNDRDRNGQTALHLAAETGDLKTVRTLLSLRFFKNARDGQGRTPLMIACQNGHCAVARALVDYRVDKRLLDEKGRSALSYATIHDDSELLELVYLESLLEKEDSTGRTPFLIAVDHASVGAMYFFKEKGADINVTTSHGDTAAHRAIIDMESAVLHALDEWRFNFDIRNNAGETPLFVAHSLGMTDAANLLVGLGADDFYNEKGETALHDAVREGDDSLVKDLIEKELLEVDVLSAQGQTSMELAVQSGNAFMIQTLAEKGASLNVSIDGIPGLHYLAMGSYFVALLALLSEGAEVTTSWNGKPFTTLIADDAAREAASFIAVLKTAMRKELLELEDVPSKLAEDPSSELLNAISPYLVGIAAAENILEPQHLSHFDRVRLEWATRVWEKMLSNEQLYTKVRNILPQVARFLNKPTYDQLRTMLFRQLNEAVASIKKDPIAAKNALEWLQVEGAEKVLGKRAHAQLRASLQEARAQSQAQLSRKRSRSEEESLDSTLYLVRLAFNWHTRVSDPQKIYAYGLGTEDDCKRLGIDSIDKLKAYLGLPKIEELLEGKDLTEIEPSLFQEIERRFQEACKAVNV